jgi:hypothetical protein
VLACFARGSFASKNPGADLMSLRGKEEKGFANPCNAKKALGAFFIRQHPFVALWT